jgi:NADH dehydrogenase
VEAGQLGVEQLVHVSGIGADAQSRSPYIRSRGEGELARLRGLGVFAMPRPLPINGLAGKVCTTAGGWGRWLWRSAVVAVVATGA